MLVKKYSNRRLYDTQQSRYITLDELAEQVRRGADARIVDAKTGADLTQATLAQIILESRGAARLLPVPLLTRLIRLDDAHLAEFMSRYMTWALEVYLQAKRGLQAMVPYNPMGRMPFQGPNDLARFFSGMAPWTGPEADFGHPPPEPPPPQPEPEPAPRSEGARPAPERAEADEPADRPQRNEMAELRRELEELKRAIQGQGKR